MTDNHEPEKKMRDTPIEIRDGDAYTHAMTNVRAVVETKPDTPDGCVRLVSTDHTKTAVTLTRETLHRAWLKSA